YPAPYPSPGAYPMPTPRPRLTRVRFREGMEVRPHGRLIERRLSFLLWPGLGVFAVSYTLGALLVIDSDDALAAIPFLGPLLWQARDGTSADLEYTIPAALFQVVGVLAFALGVKKRRYLEVWRVGDEPVPGPVTRREVAVLPNLHRHGGGISLIVR
ncbi:MAG: hypothetical protein KC586_31365, partial [Myxococcales bacterium]|nr:hypothetical protein [Myxococcales bacterium]